MLIYYSRRQCLHYWVDTNASPTEAKLNPESRYLDVARDVKDQAGHLILRNKNSSERGSLGSHAGLAWSSEGSTPGLPVASID